MIPTSKDRKKYKNQMRDAITRNIDFKLTFDEWWAWWQATGHYHERGTHHGQYVMSRYGDTGPYELNNIFCQTAVMNSKEKKGRKNPKQSEVRKKKYWISRGTPRRVIPPTNESQ